MLNVLRKAAGYRSGGLLSGTFNLGGRASAKACMLSTLAILEQRDGQLSHGSLSAFTAAKKLGGSVHGFIAGESVSTAAQEAAKVDGVEKVIAVDNLAYEKVGAAIRTQAMRVLFDESQSLYVRFGRVSPRITHRFW